jgi:hypothetical protein
MYSILYWPIVEIVAWVFIGHGGDNPPVNPAASKSTESEVVMPIYAVNRVRVGWRYYIEPFRQISTLCPWLRKDILNIHAASSE